MAKKVKDPTNYIGHEPFEVVMKRWVKEANRQLADTYREQRISDGGNNRAYEVWHKDGTHRYMDASGNMRKQNGWGWFDESRLRKSKDRQSLGHNLWYSTGHSFQIATHNPVTIVNDSLAQGIIDIKTTLGALFSEAGVGATGPKHARGRDIKVDRVRPWKGKQRYVSSWVPMQGKTHRPSTRKQANLLARRLRWAAQHLFTYQLATWMEYQFQDILKLTLNRNGDYVVRYEPDPKYKAIAED